MLAGGQGPGARGQGGGGSACLVGMRSVWHKESSGTNYVMVMAAHP